MVTRNQFDDKLNKLIQTKFSSSLLNNSKWVKLIQVLVDNHHLINHCIVKLVYDDENRQLMIEGDEQYNFDFYSTALEGMVSKPITPGWTLYKEIEWISFPFAFQDGSIQRRQELKEIKNIINKIGLFDEELTNEYYRIYAYK